MNKNDPITISKTANGFLVQPKIEPNMCFCIEGCLVFETVHGLKGFIEKHFDAPFDVPGETITWNPGYVK